LFTALIPSREAAPLPDGLRAFYNVSNMFPEPAEINEDKAISTGVDPCPGRAKTQRSPGYRKRKFKRDVDLTISPTVRDFSNALLSPRSVCNGEPNANGECDVSLTKLRVCSTCFDALQSDARKFQKPTKSVANGNYFGMPPPECEGMTHASRVLIRPIQQFGRLTCFSTQDIPDGGTRMTGHNYSTRLHVPTVFKSIPMDPRSAPSKAVVVSYYASKYKKIRQVDLASAKSDYVLQPSKMHFMVTKANQEFLTTHKHTRTRRI
jgi:hypothetical protein